MILMVEIHLYARKQKILNTTCLHLYASDDAVVTSVSMYYLTFVLFHFSLYIFMFFFAIF